MDVRLLMQEILEADNKALRNIPIIAQYEQATELIEKQLHHRTEFSKSEYACHHHSGYWGKNRINSIHYIISEN